MDRPALILYLEDNPRDAELVRDKLQQQATMAHELRVASNRAEYEAALAQTRFDLILSDYSLPDYDGMSALALARAKQPEVPFIMISGTLGEEQAVECVRCGATDYLLKQRLERLAPAVLRALTEAGEHQKRQETEKALWESEAKYRSIFENSVMGISQALPDGRLINANQSYATMYGYANAAEMISEAPDLGQRYANPDDRQEVLRILSENGVMQPREITVIRRDGSQFIVLLAAREMRDSAGNLLCYQSEHVDITERKRAEDRYRMLFESSRDAIMTLEPPSWRFTSGNPATVKMFGAKDEEEFISHGPWELSPERQPDGRVSAEKSREMIETAVRKGTHFFEWTHRRIGGEKFSADVLLTRMEQKGKVILQGSVRDITERKRAEEAIAVSNKLLQAIINTAPMRIFWKDTESRYMGCNFAFARDAGVKSPEDLIGKDDFQLGWKEHTESYRADDLRVIESGIPKLSYDETQTTPDGHHIWISTSKVPLRNEANEIIGVLGVYDDITNRKRAEDALKSSEEFIRSILSSIDEAFIVIDRDYRIVSANRAFCEQTGILPADIIGKHCYEISRHLTRPCHEVDLNCGCKRTFETGEPTVYINTLKDEKGDQTHLETKTYAMKDEAGNVKSVIEIINDITEKINLETQFRQAQKMEAIGTLAGGIAHDFNNILTAIIGFGYITLMKMGPDDPQRQNIENILEGADRAANLTKDLLIFSRKQVSEKEAVDLNEIIGKVEKFLVRVIGEDIKCSFALHNEPIVVYADPHQLEQVLMNLSTNARDAMAKSGDLIISAEQILVENDFVTIHGYGKPGRYALLTISDTGEGMDEATRKKIFEPFFTTKEVGKGTGLGLAVVYGIIKDHEGFINVYSEPGIGTSFKIYLPLISSEVRVEEIAPEKETLARGTETILLTEDDESVRKLVSIVLKQQGYTVIEAVDGAEAVKKFVENRKTIDLFLSDLIMPKMNGIEAYDEMKAWRPDLKAIFVSGYAPDVIRQKMKLDTGVALISKPILPYSLLKQVRSILDEVEK
jgi:two-component system cell cycle sensor histidine kinase/response regulator CckA